MFFFRFSFPVYFHLWISSFLSPPFITVDVFVSLAFAVALVPIFLWRDARMGRVAGAIFIASYVAYMAYRVGV